MKQDQDYFPNETNEKSFGFKVILTLVALMVLTILVVRIYSLITYDDVVVDPTLTKEPLWYNLATIVCSILSLIGLYFTWQFRKFGVYLTILGLLIIIIINPEFDLFRTLAPLFTLFVFVGYGLFQIIPKWRFFK